MRTYEKKFKIRSKGVIWGSRDPRLKFWDPLNILGVVEARNFKFGTKMDMAVCTGTYEKM